MSLDDDLETMRAQGYRAVDLAVEWLAGLRDQPVGRMPRSDVLGPLVREELPADGAPVEEGMERFVHDFMPFATLVNHPRFFAYIPCPGSWVGALGQFLAASTNLFTGSWLGGAVAAQLEEQVLAWMREALGLPEGWRGAITTGGSLANLSALAAARDAVPPDARPRAVAYVSTEAHYSVAKAARILGIDDDRIRVLPVDAAQRLVPAQVAKAVADDRARGRHPFFLCATLGTTTTGAIDPLQELAELCAAEGLWYHVDGAYGAAVALLPEYADVTAPLAQADSVTLDPHKWLYTPFECGCFLTRRPAELEAAFGADGEYMQDIPSDEINMFRRGPELSRGNRALKLWLVLRTLGTDALRAAIREDIRLCALACELLAADPRVRIVTPPQLSVFCFALAAGEDAGKRLMHAILEDGFLMLSSSRVGGEYVLRFCVANHRTTEADVRASVERIRALM